MVDDTITLRITNVDNVLLSVNRKDSLEQLKAKAREQLALAPGNEIQIYFDGRTLSSEQATVADLKMQDGDGISLIFLYVQETSNCNWLFCFS